MYTPPTPVELSALTAALGLSRLQVGELAGARGDPRRTAGKWITGERAMPYATLYTLVHRHTGRGISPNGWRRELDDLLAPQPDELL